MWYNDHPYYHDHILYIVLADYARSYFIIIVMKKVKFTICFGYHINNTSCLHTMWIILLVWISHESLFLFGYHMNHSSCLDIIWISLLVLISHKWLFLFGYNMNHVFISWTSYRCHGQWLNFQKKRRCTAVCSWKILCPTQCFTSGQLQLLCVSHNAIDVWFNINVWFNVNVWFSINIRFNISLCQ
jgi:hypothetical protein